jgi:hypothetical protein
MNRSAFFRHLRIRINCQFRAKAKKIRAFALGRRAKLFGTYFHQEVLARLQLGAVINAQANTNSRRR